jgi:hypothetical protein
LIGAIYHNFAGLLQISLEKFQYSDKNEYFPQLFEPNRAEYSGYKAASERAPRGTRKGLTISIKRMARRGRHSHSGRI